MQGKKLAGHVAVLVFCLGCISLGVHPLLDMAALEVETVFINLFEQQAVSMVWLSPLRTLTLLGPLPLALLALVWLGYGLAGFTGAESPLVRTAPRARRLIRFTTLLFFVLSSAPLALALASWIALEAYDWVEWLYDLNPTMQWIFNAVPPLFLPGAWILAFHVTARAFGLPPRPSRGGRLPRLFRPLRKLLVATCLLATAVVATAATPQMTRVLSAPSSAAFKEQCSSCHFRTASLNFTKTPEAWAASIETMQELAGGSLPPDELEQAQEWLTLVRSRSNSMIFHSRCSRCHGLTYRNWDARTAEDWGMLVDRVARWSPVFYAPETRGKLTSELVRRRGSEEATLGLDPELWNRFMTVARACSPCHSMGWNAEHYEDGDFGRARALVERMNQKMVDPLTESEMDTLTRDYLELISDPERFDRLFPHDRSLPEPLEGRFIDRRPRRGGGY
ncbi:MAG: hypothetical protein VX498_13090 [Myxococcota bacterium]|nr:hypothetical protein [Myxococcota bacterium]